MSVCVLDSESLLGAELSYQLGEDAIPVRREELDLLDDQQVVRLLLRIQPTAVINAAAYDDVCSAEIDRERCFAVNAIAVKRIAEACQILRCPLVHLSTNQVFGGDPLRRKPYGESEPTRPVGVFAHSKRAGEVYAAGCHRHFIIRTSDLYPRFAADSSTDNFVELLVRKACTHEALPMIGSQYCTPSYAPHVAGAILSLLRESEAYGIYHIVNSGITTWLEFAEEVFRKVLLDPTLPPLMIPGSYQEGGATPRFSVLDMTRYRNLSRGDLPTWQSALGAYFASREEALGGPSAPALPTDVVHCNCDDSLGPA